jgi:hypothetical protein
MIHSYHDVNMPLLIPTYLTHSPYLLIPFTLLILIGYKEVRVVPGNRGLAFVEFNNERDSSMALNKYNGYSLGDKNMSISFQKRID